MRLFWIKIGLLTIFCLILGIDNSLADEFLRKSIIKKDKILAGRVIIEGKVIVERGATLYIEPGTQIFFKNLDEDGDGLSETSIWVYGNIIAKGESGKRILFTSYEKEKKWGDWREIQINHCKGFVFEYVDIQYSEYGLHIHFSEGEVRNSLFRYNNDCTRLGNSKILFKNNLFEKNLGKALNFTNCNITFEENVVRNNREGVFVFEKSGTPKINNNNIYDNFKNVKTGDFFKEELILGSNYLYPAGNIEGKIRVDYLPEPLYGILPKDKDAYKVFTIKTDGYVDGTGIIKEKKLYFPSFDGNIYEFHLEKEETKRFYIDDFSDSVPIISDNRLFYQNWAGKIGAIDLLTEKKIFQISHEKSLKDDHRNPSPLLWANRGIFLSPGGSLIIIDTKELKEIYKTRLEGEFRGTPLLFEERLYITSTDGVVYLLHLKDLSINKIILEESFYSSPVVYKDYILIVGKKGNVFFLDRELNVVKKIELNASFRYQSPVLLKDKLYIFSLDGKIISFDDRGILSITKIDEIFTGTPAIYKDFLVVPSFYGNLYFYKEGKAIKIENLGEMQFSPFVYGDIIIVGSRSNRVYGIKIW